MAEWWEKFTDPVEAVARRLAGINTPAGTDSDKRVKVPLQGIYEGLTRTAGAQNTGTSEPWEPWSAGGIQGEELREAVEYWGFMMRDEGAGFFNVAYGAPDVNGNSQRYVWPNEMANTNMELDAQNRGFSDNQIAWLANKLNIGNTPPPDGVELIDSGQPPPPRTGSRGGGGPKYVGPMREVVEDSVKSMLTALTGEEPEERIQELADMYMKADRERWNVARSGGEDIDPNQVVLEAIRGQEDYKRIHTLRGEGDSETRWISDRQARLGQLGVGSQDADDRAITLAQAGTNLNDVQTGAFQYSKGKKDITLMNKFEKSAERLARMI